VAERVLVTGALGCLGAWTIAAVLEAGDEPVGYDLGDDRSRLQLVLGARAAEIDVVTGDIADREALERTLDRQQITRVVHLAALQVPFCRDDPVLGATVNVVGTVNVLEAVKRRLDRIAGIVYASSAAVYGPLDPSPAPERGGTAPGTHYGVYKLANEGNARVAWQDDAVPSLGIRPYVVYGPGRDQGLTSAPTLAMAAAARGEGHRIGYGGTVQYDYAPDVGRAFARAALAVREGASVANFPGVVADMAEVVAAIEAAAPEVAGAVTWDEIELPFPEALEAVVLERELGPLRRTSLADGVAATVARFREAHRAA
jgi:nucleoside-diphosphate-sugar epimerase